MITTLPTEQQQNENWKKREQIMANSRVLTNSMLGDYVPYPYGAIHHRFLNSRKPPFHLYYVPFMMHDPAIRMSMLWVRGRIISQARITVQMEGEENETPADATIGGDMGGSDENTLGDASGNPVKKFIIDNMSRFWRNSVNRILMALDWGYSGSEVIYRIRGDRIEFDTTRSISPYDVKPVTKNGRKVGVVVKHIPGRRGRVYIGGPKSFWHVHRREVNPWWGESKLIGAFEPWYELASDGGAKDVRRLYYYKYAFQGDALYYPPGVTATSDGSGMRNNKDIAREIVEKRRSGAVAVFPNTTDPITGAKQWEWLPAQSGPGSVDVLEYYDRLRNEIREGLGVPPEIFTAAQTGSGYSGRVIPQEGFDASLQDVVNTLCHDFDQQILQPLIRANFGPEALGSYEIIPKNLGDLQSKPTLPGEEGEESTDTPTVQQTSHTRNVNVKSDNNTTRRTATASQ